MTFRRLNFWMSVAACLGAFTLTVSADPELLPLPRPLDPGEPRPGTPRGLEPESCPKFSPAEFDRSLARMKAEREALEKEQKTARRTTVVQLGKTDNELRQFESKLKKALHLLKEDLAKTEEPKTAEAPKTPEPAKEASSDGKKDDGHDVKSAAETKPAPPEPLDVLTLAQMQMRTGQYEDSLAMFRKVDLEGKKANERMPIKFLTASCLIRVGKPDEAVPLLRDVANSRGDEYMAQYAQWQLEMIKWNREVSDRLQDIRQRRTALEKKQ